MTDPSPEAVIPLHGSVAIEIDPLRLPEDQPYWFRWGASMFALTRESDGTLHMYCSSNPIHVQELRAQHEERPGPPDAAVYTPTDPLPYVRDMRNKQEEWMAAQQRGDQPTPHELSGTKEAWLVEMEMKGIPTEGVREALVRHELAMKAAAAGGIGQFTSDDDLGMTHDDWVTLRENVRHPVYTPSLLSVRKLLAEYDSLWHRWKEAVSQ